MRIYIDCFDALGDLAPRDRGNPEKILAILRKTGRFSAFEHQKTLNAVMDLVAEGRLRFTDVTGYPWQSVEVIR